MSLAPSDQLPPGGAESGSSTWALELIQGRQNFTPRRLLEPGPSEDQLEALMQAAAAAPDHGELTPWHFILIPSNSRQRLGEVFRVALMERDAIPQPSA